jgi:hypothetical protein
VGEAASRFAAGSCVCMMVVCVQCVYLCVYITHTHTHTHTTHTHSHINLHTHTPHTQSMKETPYKHAYTPGEENNGKRGATTLRADWRFRERL